MNLSHRTESIKGYTYYQILETSGRGGEGSFAIVCFEPTKWAIMQIDRSKPSPRYYGEGIFIAGPFESFEIAKVAAKVIV